MKGQSIGAVIYTAADGLAARNFQTFFQDSRGRLWVGSYGDGVSCFDGETWKKWGTNNGLPNGKIISIYEDHAGNIWLDHNEWGASRLRQGRFEHLMRNAGDETNRRFFFNYCSGEPITWDTKSGNLYRFDDSVQTFLSQGKQLIPANWPQRYQTIGIYQAVTSNSYLVWALHAGARHSDILLCSPGHLPTLLNTMTGPAIRLEPCGASDDGSTVLFNREKKEFQVLTSGRIHPWPVPPLPDVKRPLESKMRWSK